ncbi:hypothetical protein ADUPG1_004602, partial [Aduncisulcus paluster]
LFFYRFRVIIPPYLKLTSSDKDVVTLCLFGQTLLTSFSTVRILTCGMSLVSASEYLCFDGCDWETPLRELLGEYHAAPDSFRSYYFLPPLHQYRNHLPATFPDSSVEFGGLGYVYQVRSSPIAGMGVFARRQILPGEP